jgi:hypothetical protein
MPALTRRRSDNPHHETWHVYYGDVPVGAIGERAGVPVDVDQWEWTCGFYPGLDPGQHRTGTALTFDKARTGFEDDWQRLLREIPEGAFDAYRKYRAFHAWKEGMWANHCKLPTQNASGRSKCFCGDEINLSNTTAHIYERHMRQL